MADGAWVTLAGTALGGMLATSGALVNSHVQSGRERRRDTSSLRRQVYVEYTSQLAKVSLALSRLTVATAEGIDRAAQDERLIALENAAAEFMEAHYAAYLCASPSVRDCLVDVFRLVWESVQEIRRNANAQRADYPGDLLNRLRDVRAEIEEAFGSLTVHMKRDVMD